MMEFFKKLFSQDFMPHGHCLFWKTELLRLYVIGDGFTAIAYYTIPIAIVYFVYKRKDIAFKWIFVLFAIFIILCGTTHLMFIWTLWNPMYRLEIVIKLLTAAVSIATAIILWLIIPKALALPSPKQLSEINHELTQEINKHKHTEEQLKASEKDLINSERLAVMGKLSGGIAHEIRNPLSTISTSAYYLKERLKDADEKIISHIDRISKQVDFSNDIIQDMQDLTGMKELKKAQIDIAVAVEGGINSSTVPQTVNIINEVPEGKFIVTVDVKQISTVFKNILANAREAMDNEGTIRITAHKSEDKWVEVSFQDSGPGITQEDLKKIFQPFFGTKTSGFGFGLALCKTIMEKHGGEIMAQSEEGKETTFIVRLPADRHGFPC
ncbi:MAG: sensor histidine kinase [Candidatus Scalindua sp.]